MPAVDHLVGSLVAWNNATVRRHASDRFAANPRPVEDLAWHRALQRAYPEIRAEWDAFADGGGQLPNIEDLIDEHQGNDGPWRAGLLVRKGRPIGRPATRFPATLAALAQIPGLWSALWSVFDPGSELPEHAGPDAGVMRYHLGIDCGHDAALSVGGAEHPYRDGEGILFDDTAPHSAWNRGPRPRVTLFCEILRPVDGPARFTNTAIHHLVALDARYRRAPVRAADLDLALNGS